jgi:hypothetical protein
MVGLHVIPYDSHRYSKWSLNSLPLLYIKWRHCGYLHNQVLFTNLAIHSEVLSKILSAINSSLLLTVCQRSRLTTGISAILNQLEAGLIMVRAIKSICELSLPLGVYGPMRSTQTFPRDCIDGLWWEGPVFLWPSLINLARFAGLC